MKYHGHESNIACLLALVMVESIVSATMATHRLTQLANSNDVCNDQTTDISITMAKTECKRKNYNKAYSGILGHWLAINRQNDDLPMQFITFAFLDDTFSFRISSCGRQPHLFRLTHTALVRHPELNCPPYSTHRLDLSGLL